MQKMVALQTLSVYLAWARSYWWPSRRVHYTLLLCANLAFVGWCWHWRLLPEAIGSFV